MYSGAYVLGPRRRHRAAAAAGPAAPAHVAPAAVQPQVRRIGTPLNVKTHLGWIDATTWDGDNLSVFAEMASFLSALGCEVEALR